MVRSSVGRAHLVALVASYGGIGLASVQCLMGGGNAVLAHVACGAPCWGESIPGAGCRGLMMTILGLVVEGSLYRQANCLKLLCVPDTLVTRLVRCH
eukprot:CAMPEP_0183727688 /NCGR_PEP_ID=MMETSP0737-20130205/26150_1 /TAXON_ID=385413 /ORGANISM="Thalassiosira miniscula, Strain CCMP1093" /LENGTH=96 /DNA_ID=CAMNT_0025959389 /DNA_START=417 /DNA_END=707 /DNA_ORIENTATION=-